MIRLVDDLHEGAGRSLYAFQITQNVIHTSNILSIKN